MPDMMPKEQSERIAEIERFVLDATNMTKEEAYNFAFRCWQLDFVRVKDLEKLTEERDTFKRWAYEKQQLLYSIGDKVEQGYELSAAKACAEAEMWQRITLREKELTEENERLKMYKISYLELQLDTVKKLADLIWDGELDSLNISVGKKFYNKQEFIDETAKKLLEGKL